MFKIGDLIVYGQTNVCEVKDITKLEVPYMDEEKLYYVLDPLYEESVIYTPVDNDKVFMRPVITKEQAEDAIAMIPNIKAEPYYNKSTRELSEHYNEIIQTLDCVNLLKLTMSIYAKKQELEEENKKPGMIDKRFMEQAEELLFGELAVALEIPREDIPAYIKSKLRSAQS